jgi:hypothetical protein
MLTVNARRSLTMRLGKRLPVSFLFLLLVPILLHAQVDRGTINGTVMDSTGAVLAGVEVTSTNLDNGLKGLATTNANGLYTILNLPVGRYSLKFQKSGFRQLERKGVTISVLQVAAIDAILPVGQVSETVTVTDDAPVIDTETSNIGADIKANVVADLPLNVSGGRDIENFAFAVMPGVEGTPYQTTIDGTQNFTKEVKIDGTSSTATIQGDQMEAGPSMEAVQEVDAQTSGLSAENSSTNGGVELFTLKSGTNQFHGSGFGYGHNEILDANTWSNDNEDIAKSKSRFWDYGFSAGGPIILPKLYDGHNKTFIFGAFERYQQNDFTTGSLGPTVPTASFLGGDFSALLNTSVVEGKDGAGNTIYQGAIFDPATGNVFPGNKIPSSRFSAASQKIVALYQKYYVPETTGLSQNERALLGNTPSFTSNQITIKVDHNLAAKDHLSGSLIYDHRPRELIDPTTPWSPGSTTGGPFARTRTELVNSQAWRASESHVFTQNLLNVVSATYNHYWNGNTQFNTGDWSSTLGFGKTGEPNFPEISFGSARDGVAESNIGNNWTNHYVGKNFVFNETLSWLKGRHSIKFGGQLSIQPISSNSGTGTLHFSFDPSQTGAPTASYAPQVGFGFASFLLGDVYSASSDVGLPLHGKRSAVSFFAQDDFKVNHKLTLNLGLRWDITTPLHEKNGDWANYNTGVLNPTLKVPGLLQFANGGGTTFEGSIDFRQFGPHIGAAYQITSRLVARASYGIFYVPVGTNFWNGTPYGFAPGYRGTNIVSPSGLAKPAFDWDNGYPGAFQAPTKDPNQVPWGAVSIDPHTLSQGYTHQFNVGAQYKITRDLMVDVNYVGNRGERLHDGNLAFNEPDSATFFKMWDSGNAYNWVSDAPSAAAAGVPYPYQGFQGFAYQAIAPFPQVALTYGPIYYVGTPLGKSSYDALTAEVVKRTGSGLTLDMSYVYAQTLGDTQTNFEETWTNGTIQDFSKLDYEARQISPFDIRQILKGYVTYQLPFGRGRHFLASSGLLDKFVGGWSIDTLLHYNGGSPLAIYAVNPYPYGSWSAVYPNVNKTGNFGKQFNNGSFLPVTGAQAPSADKYFNGSLFSNPAPGTLGSGPVSQSALRGFGYADEDMSALKYISFGADQRYKLSLRVEFYDLFNRHYFNNPNTDITSPNFGYVTGVQGISRNGQFGARMQW